MPFASTRVIPTGWQAHHAPVATATHTGTCTITAGSTGAGWGPTSGDTPGTATPVHTGACRVEDLSRSVSPRDVAGQAVAPYPYLVAIAIDAPAIPDGARVHVDTYPDDPRLVGRDLIVVSSSYGDGRFERVLGCTLDPANDQ
jgi:hypothetical protein